MGEERCRRKRVDEKVMDVIVAKTNMKVNKKKVGEQKVDTFWEEAKKREREDARLEAQYEAIHNIMESLNMSMEQAMDVLKIPESERSKYTSRV